MQYVDNKVLGLNIAYIGGGSRGWAWNLMSDLALEEQLSGTVKLYDVDFQTAYNNEIIGNSLSKREDVKGKWQYAAVKTLEEALTGADFVVISIVPGTFKEMASDVHLPEKYGIYQSVGDTVGPGGLVRALRAIPMYVEIAESIKRYSPNAWVINYTNPMTLCTRTLYEIFPQIKAFGCCHEVFGTQKLLASMLKDLKGIENVKRSEIKVNVLGINHFTWIDKASYKNIDLMPLYREFADKYYEDGFEDGEKGHWMNSYFASANRVKFDLFRRYGLIAAAGDRHLAEFMPPWYLKDPETVRKWKFSLTPVSWRVEHREELIQKGKRLAKGEEQVELKASGEEGIRQIKALVGLEEFVTNVNLPNQGQMQGIPIGAVVETNALFSRDSIRPVMAGKLPDDVQNLVMRHVLNQETVLKAALTKNKSLAFRAFINDPLVNIPVKEAEELFNQMLENTKEYLPGWDI
ncbi:MAG: galacturan 1,4-alpha-galacturonidase [Petroclostridium sp.]|jgi:alpha-galactosidase|uniref:family 4 glycosyl hydrolase n=1 Tax=Petroclostridium xylanilyticum TaxID=1792311 RepID=UPI000B97F2A3|nr:alpha-glucosidase/alpha-galactosidase [Petroclostridium xylanilyticum]MBZ4645329.1 lplD [Clostridia bacterium]MDK2810361.1 galacturan 1,4-alpha-galacturonidase [Petroclostridium sp.]